MSRIATIGRPSEPHAFRRNLRFLALKRKVREGEIPADAGSRSQDVRDFLMAYCACFLAVTTFIA